MKFTIIFKSLCTFSLLLCLLMSVNAQPQGLDKEVPGLNKRCLDADGGNNHKVPGAVILFRTNGTIDVFWDDCEDDIVIEHVCSGNELAKLRQKCEHGCKASRCLRYPNETVGYQGNMTQEGGSFSEEDFYKYIHGKDAVPPMYLKFYWNVDKPIKGFPGSENRAITVEEFEMITTRAEMTNETQRRVINNLNNITFERTGQEEITIRGRSRARFLGLFPVERELEYELREDGSVKLKENIFERYLFFYENEVRLKG